VTRHRRLLLTALAIAFVMVTIHLTLNGLPSLGSLNPHSR
jgi:hypothetical protein